MPIYYSRALNKDEFIRSVMNDPSKVFITGKDEYDPIYGSVERVLLMRGRIVVTCWSGSWSAAVRFSGRKIVVS